LEDDDTVEFDAETLVALAMSVEPVTPPPGVKSRLVASLAQSAPVPDGFRLKRSHDGWFAHPLPGIRMKVLAINHARDTATLLIDAAPGARFPPHHHYGDEECYVIRGDVNTLGQRLGPGDFLHADVGTDHGELSTETGALVLLVVRPDDDIPGFNIPS
jgi:quercetin dioxygenase-like cupin family protein